MSNELHLNDASLTGSTLYVVVWNEAGQAWTGAAFATYTTTRADFDIAATEISGTGYWRVSFPGTAGYRRWAWFLQAGGAPSHADDVKLVEGTGYWDGTNVVAQGSLLGNVGGSVGSLATQAKADVNAEVDQALADYDAPTNAEMVARTLAAASYATAAGVQAGLDAINQSASRRVQLTVLEQFERPESGSTAFSILLRTFDGDGADVNADSTPTLAATGSVSGSLAANLSAASNPGGVTGLYLWTYTVANNATLEQIAWSASATIGGSAFSIPRLSLVCDFVAATWTTTDRSMLENIADLATLAEASATNASLQTSEIQITLGTPADTIAADIAASGGGPDLTPTGEGNYQTFFNNGGVVAADTIANLTAPRQITIQVGN